MQSQIVASELWAEQREGGAGSSGGDVDVDNDDDDLSKPLLLPCSGLRHPKADTS